MEEVEALKFTSSGLFWDESYRASQVLRLLTLSLSLSLTLTLTQP